MNAQNAFPTATTALRFHFLLLKELINGTGDPARVAAGVAKGAFFHARVRLAEHATFRQLLRI